MAKSATRKTIVSTLETDRVASSASIIGRSWSYPRPELRRRTRPTYYPAVARVVVENFQTGLALGPIPGSILLMGLGYGVPVLSSIPWVQLAECIYWGDIDTHGFAILSRARAVLPHLRSILMDEQRLLRYRELWVEESAHYQPVLELSLTPEERDVVIGLQQNRRGVRVRLEQERIGWDYALSASLGCGR